MTIKCRKNKPELRRIAATTTANTTMMTMLMMSVKLLMSGGAVLEVLVVLVVVGEGVGISLDTVEGRPVVVEVVVCLSL